MYKLRATALAQDPVNNRAGKPRTDGWGLPRQTVYMKNANGQRLADYEQVKQHQLRFCDCLQQIIDSQQGQDFLTEHKLSGKLPRIYNDPVSYNMQEIIDDIRLQYRDGKDPTLSMILRQRWLARRLAELLDDDIRRDWDWQLVFNNPQAPILKRFYDRGHLGMGHEPDNEFNNLFERK